MRSIIIVFSCYSSALIGQAGPGGVGSSSNNTLWLRSDAGVSLSSGKVTQWADQSGNNNHATPPAAIPSAKPTLVTGSVNGYPSIDLDGVDDQFWVNHHTSLNMTQWHFFIVMKADIQKDYNAWLAKGDDSDENYEMLSYSDGNIHTPIKYTDGVRTAPSSPANQVSTTTFDIFEYSYASTTGRRVYKNGSQIYSDSENKTPRTNALPLYLGNERNSTGRCIDGDLAEVLVYSAPLNSVQRIIVNNYLAAKYGQALAASDLYVHDNAGNGNYDHDVAAIGRVNSTNQQTDSRGSGILRINNATNLGDNEFMFWGHDNGILGANGSTDHPAGMQGRLHRIWRVREVNASGTAVNVGNVDMTWDLAGLGPVVASQLRLLVDTDNDGIFSDETPISGATHQGGSLYRFSGVSALVNNRRFTLGTTDMASTPLPIELVQFDVEPLDQRNVRASWTTASEQNNELFTLERSSDAELWEAAGTVPGAGNSSALIDYEFIDHNVPGKVLYYRLRQTDQNGGTSLSAIQVVKMPENDIDPVIYPNPNMGQFSAAWSGTPIENVIYEVLDPTGRPIAFSSEAINGHDVHFQIAQASQGMYFLKVTAGVQIQSTVPFFVQ